ncbi:oxaloacetate decarboxylase [Yaniella flava]|uniref:Oxaloacetate decarboxylase n=1 Tax=Yaniella flava TaxID=287930 RepID=A0ABN2TZI0_9MICC
MSNISALAQSLAEQHESGDVLVMPTVWDTWSAAVAADAGFSSLTVGSHSVADAVGSSDGENMDFTHYIEVVKKIVESVDVPVSVDVESGYGLAPSELIQRLLEVGVVGANIEDVVHRDNGRVRDREEHADYIARARAAADDAGVQFVINGRTDAVKLGTDVFPDPLEEAAERITLMEQAGARAVYPVGLSTAEEITRLVEEVSVPVNVTAHPVDGHGAGDFAVLKGLGARRITFGPLWQKWLSAVSTEQLSQWKS